MSDRVLLLAVEKLTLNFNAFLEACTSPEGMPQAPSRKEYMQARACIPKGYSMTLVKK